MTWFLLALFSTLGWGCADLFYKKGSDENDRYSHLKIAVWVGMVMGIFALLLMPMAESGMNAGSLLINAVRYAPASLSYILSMVIGYAGLRYLELSIISPVQNASGALSMICMLVYFLIKGQISGLSDAISDYEMTGTAFIVCGVLALAIVEQRLSRRETQLGASERKYRFGALALLFPLTYCVFDTIGTAADGIILNEETGLGLGEIDVLILYGLTFFLAGIVCWVLLWLKNKKPYNPFRRSEGAKACAALCEEAGQIFYVYAMAKNPVLAAPMIASYCVISALLSWVVLKEKIKVSQFLCILLVIAGIVLLGIADGLSEIG